MDALIKMKVSELNGALVERLKALFQGKEETELTITFNDGQTLYYDVLARSKNDLDNVHNLVSFTMEELETYTATKKQG